MVVSTMLIGAMLASLTGGFVIDYIGRRKAIIVNAGIFVLGATGWVRQLGGGLGCDCVVTVL